MQRWRSQRTWRTENIAILDDGGNLKAFSRMYGTPIRRLRWRRIRRNYSSVRRLHADFFNFIQGDPSLLAGIPTLARMAAWVEGSIEVDGEIVGAIGVSGAPRCRTMSYCAERP